MPSLTPKDKEILCECLDYNRDGSVDREDIRSLLRECGR